MSVNIRVGNGTAVHLGLWDRHGTSITRRACRRRTFSASARFRLTQEPVTCKTCTRLREAAPTWLVKAAYGNDPSFHALADGLHVELPPDVPLAWCARCGEQYPKPTARYSAAVDGNICGACFEATGGSRR